jgi:hypothetical protein
MGKSFPVIVAATAALRNGRSSLALPSGYVNAQHVALPQRVCLFFLEAVNTDRADHHLLLIT